MSPQHRNLLLRIGAYLLFIAAMSGLFFIDAQAVDGKFFENSYTERAQETLFLLTVAIYIAVSMRYSALAPLARVLAGFFALCFVRELDALLEQNIGTGTWQVLVTLILIGMIYVMVTKRQQFWPAVGRYVETYAFGLFAAGFLTTFAFSRIVGNEGLWEGIMGEFYQRDVKNAVEEIIELLGDTLMFFSSIEFALRAGLADQACRESGAQGSEKGGEQGSEQGSEQIDE